MLEPEKAQLRTDKRKARCYRRGQHFHLITWNELVPIDGLQIIGKLFGPNASINDCRRYEDLRRYFDEEAVCDTVGAVTCRRRSLPAALVADRPGASGGERSPPSPAMKKPRRDTCSTAMTASDFDSFKRVVAKAGSAQEALDSWLKSYAQAGQAPPSSTPT